MQPPKCLLLCIACYASNTLFAQSIGPSTIDAAGASITSGSLVYEYAVGQPVSGNTLSSPSLVLTPGVLQPLNNTASIGTLPITSADLQVFPNPVESTLFLFPSFNGSGSLQYSLYDVSNRLIKSHEIVLQSGKEKQTIDMTTLAAGSYLLRVTWAQAGRSYVSGYKLQKIK